MAAGDSAAREWLASCLVLPPRVCMPRPPICAFGFAILRYQVFEQHFHSYVAAYEERFEAHSGPLRRGARRCRAVSRLSCPSCKSEYLIAFSCRTRNFWYCSISVRL